MIQVGMRIYYDNQTGNVIFDIPEQVHYGERIEQTVERDIESLPVLSERNRETFDVLELPFGAYQQDFAEGVLVGVNLETKLPIFSYPNSEEPSEPIIVDVPLSVQISEIKAENEALRARDSSLQDDITFIFEIMGA